jgi:hypothetical protein
VLIQHPTLIPEATNLSERNFQGAAPFLQLRAQLKEVRNLKRAFTATIF